MKNKKHGVFYLLPETIKTSNHNSLSFIEKLVCNLTKTQWRLGNSILIACNNKLQAIKINEFLWKIDPNSFLPHNLFGKNTHNIPIIIYWKEYCYDGSSRNLLINLMDRNMDFFFNFEKIIDFVPKTNAFKEWARIRFKSYKNTGFQLSTIDASKYIDH